MSEKGKTRKKDDNSPNCRFLKDGGFPCDLSFPDYVISTRGETEEQALNHLCIPCQDVVRSRWRAARYE